MRSKSPLPPFCKGENSTDESGNRAANRSRSTAPARVLLSFFALLSPSPKGDRGGFAVALRSLLVALALTFAIASPLSAQPANDPAPLQFHDAGEEARFHALAAELRCVMCQNQSLAESNAQIAHDLRREVLALMRQGKDNRQIKQFLVARYGEFVLYRPQVESKTWLLWFGPALVLLAGGFAVAAIVRGRARAAAAERPRGDGEDDNEEW